MPAVHSDLKRNINILVLGLKNDTSCLDSSTHREHDVLIKQPRLGVMARMSSFKSRLTLVLPML